jgi:serine/threonine protein kinase
MRIQNPPPRLRPGEVLLQHYEVVRYVTSGGVCHLHEGRDRRTGGRVAIRELRSPDPFSSERLRREWETLLQLQNNPRFPEAYACGGHVLIEEYLEGGDLRTYLSRTGPLQVREALRFTFDLLEALEALHGLHCYHRDIKPDNLMVTRSGLKVLDLGLVHVGAYQANLLTRAPILTPTYAPAEQWRAERPGPETDLYAVAATLYEMLTGRRHLPFTGNDQIDEQLTATRAPTPMSHFSPALSLLDRPVLRALDPDRTRRPQSAPEMKRELQTAVGAHTLLIAPAALLSRLRLQATAKILASRSQAQSLWRRALPFAALMGLAAPFILFSRLSCTGSYSTPPSASIPTTSAAAPGSRITGPAPVPGTAAMPAAAHRARVVGANVFFRAMPGTDARVVVAGLQEDVPITLTGSRKSGWYEALLSDGRKGWIFGAHLVSGGPRPDGVVTVAQSTPILPVPGGGNRLADLWVGKKLLVLGSSGDWLAVRCQVRSVLTDGYVAAKRVRWLQHPAPP